jgi:hypothetical protein
VSWDHTQLRFPRREGMRIDVTLASPAPAGRVSGALIDREERRADCIPCRVDGAARPVVRVRHRVPTGAQGKRGVLVPQPLGDGHDRLAGRQQDTGVVVPRVVARRPLR